MKKANATLIPEKQNRIDGPPVLGIGAPTVIILDQSSSHMFKRGIKGASKMLRTIPTGRPTL